MKGLMKTNGIKTIPLKISKCIVLILLKKCKFWTFLFAIYKNFDLNTAGSINDFPLGYEKLPDKAI